MVDAVAADLAVAANQALATDIRVDELDVRVDTLETLTATLTAQASVTDTRLEAAAGQHAALRVDGTRRQVAIEARLEKVERFAEAMGMIEETSSVANDIEPPLPSSSRTP